MKRNIFILILSVAITYLSVSSAWASPPKSMEITFVFPDQGVSINQAAQVKVNISKTQAWRSGTAEMTLAAIPFVAPESDIKNITINKLLNLGACGDGDCLFDLPVTIKDNGEYEIRVAVTIQTDNGEKYRSRAFGVVAEDGKVWFGRDSIDHAVEAKVQHQFGVDAMPLSGDKKRIYKERLEEEEQKRSLKSIEKTGRSIAPSNAVKAIKKGDPMVLSTQWIGNGTAAHGNNFSMHGVKVTISDKDKDASNNPLTASITGYLIDGKFTLTAPRDNYSYKVVMETTFPGINTDGTVNTSGNGIGSFSVVKQQASGDVYKCEAENSLSITCSQAHLGGSKSSASAWAAFHGIAEMVVQAKKQLNVDKQSGFKVIFDIPTGTSHYGDSDISLLLDDRYDWDVVAHEFGHAIANETDATDTNTGGSHNGSNQYDYSSNSSTFHNKEKSLELAINEGFGTWFGGALLQNPTANYNGKFQNIGDGKYDDTEDAAGAANFESNTAPLIKSVPVAYGEDTEVAILHLLWDVMDSNNEANTRATCTTCKDAATLNLSGLWSVLNGSKISNVIELYEKLLEKKCSTTVSDLLQTGENNIDDRSLECTLNLSYTFAEFGIAPYIEQPAPKTKLDLLHDKKGPKFLWSQKKTGTLEGLTEFTLALYTFDLKTLVFKKTGITAKEYTLTESDIKDIKSAVDGLSSPPSSLQAVVIGENDYILELESGPYLSNPKEIMIKNVDRTVVIAVDSSGSNTTTDPNNRRIDAARETLRGLTSFSEAQQNNTAPDLAGAVDFDSGVSILSQLDDPDAVIPTLSSIDSSGSTDIADGINTGVQILENLNTAGLTGLMKNKAAIVVFTDGENNDGKIPVIKAIVNATAKGIRVHFGFLDPNTSFNKAVSFSIPSDAPQGYIPHEFSFQEDSTLPATIIEAVLASGGVYAIIKDADSQVAFVQQIENRGITNADNSDPGGQHVVGQTKTFDMLVDPLSSRSFQFSGVINEDVRIFFDTDGNFHPSVQVFNREGNIVAFDYDADADGLIELGFILPYTGDYYAIVRSQDGNTGLFSVFVDVQNPVQHFFSWSSFLPAILHAGASCTTVPTLLYPDDESNISSINPVYEWDSGNSPEATKLRLEVATDEQFTQKVNSLWGWQTAGAGAFRFSRNLEPGTRYYWRTWLQCGHINGPSSEVRSFITGSGGTVLPAPALITPTDGSNPAALPVTVQWSPVSGASEFLLRWQPAEDNGYTYSWVNETEQDLGWLDLDPNTVYEWWTSAGNAYAVGAESASWQFTTPLTAPSLMEAQDAPGSTVKSVVYEDGEFYHVIERKRY